MVCFPGVRALACADDGSLVDDFLFYDDENVVNVCNAPSPAATSSLSIGDTISDMILKKMNVNYIPSSLS